MEHKHAGDTTTVLIHLNALTVGLTCLDRFLFYSGAENKRHPTVETEIERDDHFNIIPLRVRVKQAVLTCYLWKRVVTENDDDNQS